MIAKHKKLMLYGILLLAGVFRLYAVNWDQGFHLHPDERAIVLSVVTLHFPHSLQEFLSPNSPWSPKFFAYGSFPFYLLWAAGNISGFLFHPLFAAYDGINLVGRVLSAFFDLATIGILYALGNRFFRPTIGLIAATFYAISVLPIQLSHFYAVDTILTCFVMATLYFAIRLEQERTWHDAVFVGIFFGLALATKVSAIVLGLPIAMAFLYMLITRRRHHHQEEVIHPSFATAGGYAVLLLISSAIIFALTEPYALLDFHRFLNDTQMQSEMTKNAFTFPYTLQYVGKIPYWYELKNIFLFGQGPFLAAISFIGTLVFLITSVKETRYREQARNLILLSFFIVYFLLVGGFKVGFMRYMLPIYPLLCLFAAYVVYIVGSTLYQKWNTKLFTLCSLLLALSLLLWPVSFLHIYTKPNTRVSATNWITTHIPKGKTIAVEHWDDSLPLTGQDNYTMVTLPLYDEDTDAKWQTINATLKKTDYIIVASNRLYTPLLKLTNCTKLPPGRCYKRTAEYYHTLFSGRGNFAKVAEFTDYPTIPILNIPINDQGADESFTVYDHPKVMIFKRKNS